jgi:hypothetical protein
MDRRTILKSLATTAVLPVLSVTSHADAGTGKCADAACMSDANAVRQFLSDFLQNEESTLDHDAVIKLMKQRGRACCRALKFRQELIEKSEGNTDKLVEMMGNIVGRENCRRMGNQVTLIYPQGRCVCGWSPQRPPTPNDPYCECSASNNQTLFETVTGRVVSVKVAESPRRGGKVCKFLIQLT